MSTIEVPARRLPALAAYEQLAPHYDAFTAHHDYELWLGELLPALRRSGLAEGTLLDLGCGTGKSFLPMLERGWRVTAADLSPGMLAIAAAKAGDRARLLTADLRALPRLGRFDLVWALDDAVNYLTEVGDLESAMAGIAANLAPHGRLLFDLNTLLTYRTFFAETHTSRCEPDGVEVVWEGRAGEDFRPGEVAEARVEARQGERRSQAVHRQRHHPVAAVERALHGAGLECLAVYGHGYDARLVRPLDEALHTKSIFIARLAQSQEVSEGGAT